MPVAVQIARRVLIEEVEVQRTSTPDKKPAVSKKPKASKPIARIAAAKITPSTVAIPPKLEATKPRVATAANKPKITAAKTIKTAESVIRTEHQSKAIPEIRLPSTAQEHRPAVSEAALPEALPSERFFAVETVADITFQPQADATSEASKPLETLDETGTAADQLEFVPTVELSEDEWIDLAIRDILSDTVSSLNNEITPESLPESSASPEESPLLDMFSDVLAKQDDEPIEDNQEIVDTREQLAEYLELSTSGEAETAIMLVEGVVLTANKLLANKTDESVYADDGTAAEKITEKLEDLCRQLFEILGLGVDEERIETFLESISQNECMPAAGKDPLIFREDGTHEQKKDTRFILNMLAQMLNKRLHRHSMIGKLALRFRLNPYFVRPEVEIKF